MDAIFGWFFRLFNWTFSKGQNGYARGIKTFGIRKGVMMTIFGILVIATYFSFSLVPPGFVPAQDKKYLISFAQLPAGATLERTQNVMKKMADIAMKEKGVANAVQFPGLSVNGFVNSSSAGIMFIPP